MKIRSLIWIVIILITLSTHAFAQILQLVEDINKTTYQENSYLTTRAGIVLNGIYVYGFDDGIHGMELWVSDGSTAGTKILKDIASGFLGSNPYGFTVHDGFIYFSANDLIHGEELWRTDGTAHNTTLVKDFNPGPRPGTPSGFFSFDEKLILAANDGNGFKTISLHEGQTEILSPSGFIYYDIMANLIRIGNVMFYAASNLEQTKMALWKTDGTVAGTQVVKEFENYATPVHFQELNGVLYFMLTNQPDGMEFWRSDGTESGTALFHDLQNGYQYYEARQIVKYRNHIYIGGGGYMWKTDGSQIGTTRLEFLEYGNMDRLFTFGSDLYLVSNYNEIAKSDGTVAGTTTLANANSTWDLFELAVLDDKIIFTKQTPEFGTELWQISGSNVTLVKDSRVGAEGPAIKSLVSSGTKAYFFALDGAKGYSTWVTDGTESGTNPLHNIQSNPTAGSHPQSFDVVGNRLLFSANDPIYGAEPYMIDSNGTLSMVADFTEGTQGSLHAMNYEGNFFSPDQPIGFHLGGVYYFFASSGYPARSLFKLLPSGDYQKITDVGNQTAAVKFIHTPDKTKVFFVGQDNTNGTELWITDGTEIGTHMVKDIVPGMSFLFSNQWSWEMTPDGILYFSMGGEDGGGLWRSDGTADGTYQLKDTNPTGPDHIDQMKFFNNYIFFSAASQVGNSELWRSDGTPEGTRLVKEINANTDGGFIGAFPAEFVVYNNKLFFSAYSPDYGRELWITDGTEDGTKLLKDINAGPKNGLEFGYFTVYKDGLYFAANDGVHGAEIWKTDGTEAGTMIFVDLSPGSKGSDPKEIVVRKNSLLFYAWDGVSNPTLWASKGDVSTTSKIYLDGEIGEAHPWMSAEFNDKIYISAQGKGVGMELFSISQLSLMQSVVLPPVSPKTFGDAPFVINASATSGLPVSLTSSEPSVIKIENGQAFVMGVGSATISATQSGNADFMPAQKAITLTVNKKSQVLVFDPVPAKTFGNAAFTLTANSTSALPVTFVSSTPSILAIEGNVATIKGAGSVEITVTQNGNSNYLPAESISQALTISKATQAIDFPVLEDKKQGDKPFDLSINASSGLPVWVVSSNPLVATVDGNRVTIHKSGETILTANQSGNENYLQAPSVARTMNVLLITGIEQNEIGIYPNPVVNDLIIRVSSHVAGRQEIKIYDSQGNEAMFNLERVDDQSIGVDFSGAPQGIYLVKVGLQTFKVAKR